MEYVTLDDLILKLQQCKDSGVPGSIAVGIPSFDNNGRGGVIKRIESVCQASVAKVDMDKGYSICKTVANRGVEILLIR
jgi:hypothetical protein